MSRTWWAREQTGAVNHVELGAGRIELNLALGDRRYAVVLEPAPGGPAAWKGAWTRAGHPGTGAISARVYRAADGGLAVIGDWNEDGTVYRWAAEFDAAR
jgi:hypothetical protein